MRQIKLCLLGYLPGFLLLAVAGSSLGGAVAVARRRWGAGGLSGSVQGLDAPALRQLSPGG